MGPAFKLSLRENALNGVEEERVWASRDDRMNANRLRHDGFVMPFRFLAAHEQRVDTGETQVWVHYFVTWDDAKAFLDAHADRGQNGSIYAILPPGFGT